jgi:recombination protein RecA
VRLDIRRIQSLKVGSDVVGNRTRVKVKKNKVAPPFAEAEFDIMYNEGISKVGDVLDLGVVYELIDKRGAYFRYGETLLGQGRENAKTYLMENPDMVLEIEGLIRQSAGLGARPAGNFDPDELVEVEID